VTPGNAMMQSEAELRKTLEEQLRFEALLVDLSTGFVALSTDEVDGAIEDAQRRIVQALALDRSSLFQYTAEGEMVLTHSWVRPGLQPFPPRISAMEHYPWLTAKVMKGEVIRFSSINELPSEAARDAEAIRKLGPRSNVTFPLVVEGRAFGALAFGALREERPWPDNLVARLRLVAGLFTNALARKRSEESLRQALDEVHGLKDQLQREVMYLQGEVKALHGHAGITGASLPSARC
jgi:formate hydrogenlyase transcriptional activator